MQRFIILLSIFSACLGADEAEISRYQFRFLTTDVTVIDGRPVFTPDGKKVIFMRQPNNDDENAISSLYIVPASGKGNAKLFYDGINPKTGKQFNVTRPDYSWCRSRYEIAFDATGAGIWLLDVKTKKVKQVLENVIGTKSYTWSYPAWYPDGKSLSVTNYNTYGEPLYHSLVKANACALNSFTLLTNNQVVWPGMSTVSHTHPHTIAYAGEPPVAQPPATCTCPGGCVSDGYAQNCNQIWMQNGQNAFQIDSEQGRAPWFSPCGNFIVFESNRDNPDFPDLYRLYIYSLKDGSIKPITPPSLNVQHGKWSPDGKKIVFAYALYGGAQGIALVDLE